MGYRELLKKYMRHVNELVGDDLIEIAAITNAMRRRELGELRTLAAENERDVLEPTDATRYRKIVRSMVDSGSFSLVQLGKVQGIETQDKPDQIPEDQFRRIVKALAESVEQ